jgi:hypothetical protein
MIQWSSADLSVEWVNEIFEVLRTACSFSGRATREPVLFRLPSLSCSFIRFRKETRKRPNTSVIGMVESFGSSHRRLNAVCGGVGESVDSARVKHFTATAHAFGLSYVIWIVREEQVRSDLRASRKLPPPGCRGHFLRPNRPLRR